MRNLSQRQLMIVILTSTSSLQAQWDNLQKKMESSKATVKHVKQVVKWPHKSAQIISDACHQCTVNYHLENSSRKQKKPFKSRKDDNQAAVITIKKNKEKECHQVDRKYDNYQAHARPWKMYKICCDSQHIEGFRCPARKHQMKEIVTSMVI